MIAAEQFEAARRRGDNAAMVRLALERDAVDSAALRRNMALPPRLVEAASPQAPAAGVDTWEKPVVFLNRSIFERLRDLGGDGREGGVWLCGRRDQEPRAIELHRALWPAFDQDREPNAITIHWSEVDQINEALDRDVVLGHAHTHSRTSWPSQGDIDSWTVGADRSGGPFVGITVADRLNPRDAVDVRAFVISRAKGSVVCRAAEIFWRDL